MKEYSNGIKGAAIVIHQMFFVLMVCSLYGVGYDIAHHIKGIAGLSTLIVIGLVGGFVMLAYLTSVTGRHGADDPEVYLNFVDRIYTDIQLLVFGFLLYGAIYVCREIGRMDFEFSGLLVAVGTLGYLADVVFLFFYLSIVRKAKSNTLLTHSLIYQGIVFVREAISSKQNPRYCTRKARERYEIQNAIEEISKGALDTTLNVDDFQGQERDIAIAVNNIREGLSEAVMERIRNERIKADLITNVSHDIKTPLTSIINYVDLIKRQHIEDPTVQKYLEVLDQKSQRLKTLTEDLVEASRASSGNIKLEITNIDFVELVQQTTGEFEEKYAIRHLEIVNTLPNEVIMIEADGRRLWRVLENLYNNAFKYALEGTRVYVTIEDHGADVVFTIKNVSANPLNISPDELTERFVRGDVSRTTEGSGLGLSIAKDLTTLQGGKFELIIDGDLFKAQITFPIKN